MQRTTLFFLIIVNALSLTHCSDSDNTTSESSALPESLIVKAWVGSQNSEVIVTDAPAELEFYRSRDADCDLNNYASCTNGELSLLSGSSVIVDSALTLLTPAYYQLRLDEQVTKNNLQDISLGSNADFNPRSLHQVTAFKNKLWLIGGDDNTFNSTNDVWSSSDGITWNLETRTAEFSARASHQTVVFNNKIWLIAGHDGNHLNDVWSSEDGITWTEVSDNAEFSVRSSHQVVVFNNKLWVIGGFDFDNFKNDVWSSSDGLTWTQVTDAAPFSPRAIHQTVVFNNKLWVVGGFSDSDSGGNNVNDVWSSNDGETWVVVTNAAAFSARSAHQAFEFNNKLWLIGGDDDDLKNDVWSSTNGADWTLETVAANFSSRLSHQALVFNEQLWVIAGNGEAQSSGTSLKNDIWRSDDGVNWRLAYRGMIAK